MVTIRFDAGTAKFMDALPKDVEDALNQELMWRDRSIEYMNSRNTWNQRYTPQDSRKYCYNYRTRSFPTGLLPRVLQSLVYYKVPYTLEPHIRNCTPLNTEVADWAWDHQREIVRTLLKWKRCIAQSPTASGKTTSIALILEQFPDANCLITVPSLNLVQNIRKDVHKKLGIPVGCVGGGNDNWEQVTVATARSLSLHAEGKYRKFMEAVDLLIFDECHNFGNKTGNIISNACKNSSYRLGISATVTREDGSDIVLEGVIGPWALTIPDTVMVDLEVIHRPKLYFVNLPKPQLSIHLPAGESKPDRNLIYEEALVYNDFRNNLIADIALAFLQKPGDKGVALVLVERVEHGKLLQTVFADKGVGVPYIWGGCGKDRQAVIERFRSGELTCLLASRILNEGEDVPLLELVINAAGGSGKRGIIQKAGRGLRKDASGKKRQAIIVDFYDHEPFYLTANSQARIRNISERHPDCVQRCSPEELLDFLRTGKSLAATV